jgi:hypothetical protein
MKLFHINSRTRLITISFLEIDISPRYIREGTYDESISYFFNKNRKFHNSDSKLNYKLIYKILKVFQDYIDNDNVISENT